MGKEYFAEEFKLEAVRQVVERGFSVADVAKRLANQPEYGVNDSVFT